MPAPTRRERYAHRARWRPVPKSAHIPPPDSRTALASGRQVPDRFHLPPTSKPDSHVSAAGLDLPQLFAPGQAAEILRHLGLTEMTECALRTRAYRRQVPFHLNGRRIRFTASDLREIVEGQPRRPEPTEATPSRPARGQPPRRSLKRPTDQPPPTWRARRPHATPPPGGREQPR
jgi:hypothetical protein